MELVACVCLCMQLFVWQLDQSVIEGKMAAEGGLPGPRDGTTLKNEMPLVSMAANDTVVCFSSVGTHRRIRKMDRCIEEGGKERENGA